MEKQLAACPWCHGDVQVEPGRRHLYICPFCKKTFTFVPTAVQAADKPPALPTEGETATPADFVETPFVKELADRILAYLQDGLYVHLCGPAGSGKTTLALHVAQQLGRPVVLIHGDDQMGTADLVGKESGYKRSYTRDQYVL